MKEDTIYIYGKHAVGEAIRHRPDTLRKIFFSHEFSDTGLREQAKRLEVSTELFSEKKMPGGVSREVTHQGVMAAVSSAALLVDYRDFLQNLNPTLDTALVLLAEVQDPQNVGAVIRSAAAFGVAGVLLPQHNQAPITGAVVKVSVGMAFTVPLVTIGNVNTTIKDLKDHGFWVYGLAAEGSQALYEEDFSKPTVFVLGNEAEGIREKTKEACDVLVHIPMHARAESLNASSTAAVTLSHWSAGHRKALE